MKENFLNDIVTEISGVPAGELMVVFYVYKRIVIAFIRNIFI